MTGSPEVLFCGGNGSFSAAALRHLHAAGIGIGAVLRYGYEGAAHRADTPFAVTPRAPDALARGAAASGARQLYVHDLNDPDTVRRLQAFGCDVLLSVCFPRRLPGWLRRLPALACLNLHPSLLPAYRGPAPLFWQFRNGETALGVTLHGMVDELDAGPVLAQRRVALRDGLTHAEIAEVLAGAGIGLLAAALPDLQARSARYTAQDPRARSCHPAPRAVDFTLDLQWSARRAFNFMRATEHHGQPYPLPGREPRLLLERALGVSDSDAGSAGNRAPGALAIAFRRGTLYARAVDGDARDRRRVGCADRR